MIGVPIGLLTGNAIEWYVHKNILHGLGKNKDSFWRFHWKPHHNLARKNLFRDENYERSLIRSIFKWDARAKEAAALFIGAAAVTPLILVFPTFTGTIWYCALNYYRVHRKSHMDTDWGKTQLPWHYDHHMGRNQDSNWCVTKPWMDLIMGTREYYHSNVSSDKDIVSKTIRFVKPKISRTLKTLRRVYDRHNSYK